jgi:hypothetical protein
LGLTPIIEDLAELLLTSNAKRSKDDFNLPTPIQLLDLDNDVQQLE